jgi:multiple sugar transport system ATP-binding protein
MVFQSYALYPRMTVRRNLSFALRVSGMDRADIDERVARASRMLQLDALLDRYPSQLSGGQRQRVAIGRALVRDVDVFLFDEPLSNLDAKLRNELRVEIKRLHQALGNTMIYVTHDQIEALTLADRIAVMKEGVIRQLDAPSEVYSRPRDKFVASFIGSPQMNFLEGTLSTQGGRTTLKTAVGDIDVSAYPFLAPPVSGMPATIGFRPEQVLLGHDTPGWHPLSATVTVVEPMGPDSVVWADWGGNSLAFRVVGEVRLQPGFLVNLSFDVPHASLFGPDDKRL